MNPLDATQEAGLRLAAFLGVLAAVALWQQARPARPLSLSSGWRWAQHLTLGALNALAVRLLLPGAAIAAAAWAATREFGVLHWLDVPSAAAVVIALPLLDLAVWAQHRAMHAVPALWRLHRVHHADPDFDVTTGVRFHPFEILLSMLYKMAVVVVLGAPAIAVLVFEILLSVTSLFSHANAALPRDVDRAARLLLVTPDMHRVHHSTLREETDSNFGFCVPWWDRLFGTYRAAPRDGEAGLRTGLEAGRTRPDSRIDRLLLMPFGAVDGRAD
jgi:sterol desaturase/sphingolipid hydroxylase (fatty acid hydroxylase superfamily)